MTLHTAVSVKQFVAKHGIPELKHTSYSPDLSQSDFLFISKIKSTLKGRSLEDREDIKKEK
jgi:hypothetical protein